MQHTDTRIEREEQAQLLARFMEITKWGDDMRAHFAKTTYFITLSGGEIFEIDKPSITTRFCCGEDDRGQGGDGYGTMRFALDYLAEKRTEAGFKRANLSKFDEKWVEMVGRKATRRRWHKADFDESVYFLRPTYDRQNGDARVVCVDAPCSFGYYRLHPEEYRRPSGSRDLTAEDVRLIRAGYAKVRKDFRRRLNAYWKRYKASKVRTWTYWTEA